MEPSQCSASGTWNPLASAKDPTAMQDRGDVHDTALSPAVYSIVPASSGGLGVGRTLHRAPFQRSANVEFSCPPGGNTSKAPTAMQAVGALQETPWRVPPSRREPPGALTVR